MLDKLIKKFDDWSIEKRNSFHNNSVLGSLDSNYIWYTEDDGFYIIRDQGSIYVGNNGEVHSFTLNGSEQEWQSHILFYKQTSNNPLCRFDIPIKFQTLEHKDTEMFYKIYYRPNKQQGKDYHQYLFENKVDNEFVSQYIDDASILLSEFKKFTIDNNLSLPSLGASIVRRRYDERGHFWIDLKNWSISYDDYVQISIETLSNIIKFSNYNKLTNLDEEKIINKSREKWTTI